MRLGITAFVSVFVMSPLFALAQDGPAPVPPQNKRSTSPAPEVPANNTGGRRDPTAVSPEFRDVLAPESEPEPELTLQGDRISLLDIRDVKMSEALRFFSMKTGVNVVAASSVASNEVSIYLRNVTPTQALKIFSKLNGLVFEEDLETGVVTLLEEDETQAANVRQGNGIDVMRIRAIAGAGKRRLALLQVGEDNIMTLQAGDSFMVMKDGRPTNVEVTDIATNAVRIRLEDGSTLSIR